MKALLIASVTLLVCLSNSCNTFIGMGRDIRLLGQGMEDSANNTGTKDTQKQTEKQGGAPVY